jgi:hypothetical protein
MQQGRSILITLVDSFRALRKHARDFREFVVPDRGEKGREELGDVKIDLDRKLLKVHGARPSTSNEQRERQ